MSKTWLITGASSGLGLEMTQQLLARGDRVIATVRREQSLAPLQRQYSERLNVLSLDLSDKNAIQTVIDEAFYRHNTIDVVVSNAGYGLFGAAEELSDAQIEAQLTINLTGSIRLIRAVLPHLRRQKGGRIMQVSSEGGQIAYPNFSLYHASKWGIEGFIEATAQEVVPFGIDFIIAEPGPTATNFGAGLVHAEPMQDYEATTAGDVRRAISEGAFPIKGDAVRTVAAMIASADMQKPPFRLPLGSQAYISITTTLTRRLAEIEQQRAVAFSADAD
ncbi:SDR family oxidoreductase [Brucellaceae bacterium D45D]